MRYLPPSQTPIMHPSPPPFRFHPLKSSSSAEPYPPETSAGVRSGSARGLLRPLHRTNPLIWIAAFLCVVLILLLIVSGILTLIIFLIIKPQNPSFDTTTASLNSVYLDSPAYLNSDLTFLANFSNPNSKIDVSFERAHIELYFRDLLVASQALLPFAPRRGAARLQAVHMISSQVFLPPPIASELLSQLKTNRIFYDLKGAFRVRASFAFAHFSYWLYGLCQIELTSPPAGVLVARRCSTKRK